MKTSSTFWSQLEADIEKYSNRAKKNIREFEKRHSKQLKNHKHGNSSTDLAYRNRSVMSEKAPCSINEIRDQYRESKDKQTSIKNRIHFLAVQRDRRIQSSQQVRQKYQKVLSIRSSSLKEKKLINQELINFQNGYYLTQKSKVIKVQHQKLSIEKSHKKLINEKYSMAKSVRLATKKNQQTIVENREKDLADKKKSVNDVQLAQQKSAEVLKKLSYRKIELGKRNHQKKVWDEYKKLQLQKSKNSTIIDHYDEKMKIIQEDKIRAEEEIKIYRDFLGLNRGKINPERSVSQRSKKNSIVIDNHSAFYLTG